MGVHPLGPVTGGQVPEPPPHGVPSRGAAAWLALARPLQWTKNVFVLAGLVFSRQFVHPASLLRAGLAVAAFCLLSSAVYCLNDVVDRRRDRLHPSKRLRPVASGAVAAPAALALGALLALAGLAVSAVLGRSLLAVAAAYLALNGAYSAGIKHVPLWDALTVAGGFVLRALAGTVAVAVPPSPWLLACTYLLTLYMSLGKRWSDAVDLAPEQAAYRRPALAYAPAQWHLFMEVTMSAALIAYALYAAQGTYGPWMLVTLPFVIYGLFRYQHLVQTRGLGGSPDTAVLRDRAFLLNGAAFGAVAMAVLLLS